MNEQKKEGKAESKASSALYARRPSLASLSWFLPKQSPDARPSGCCSPHWILVFSPELLVSGKVPCESWFPKWERKCDYGDPLKERDYKIKKEKGSIMVWFGCILFLSSLLCKEFSFGRLWRCSPVRACSAVLCNGCSGTTAEPFVWRERCRFLDCNGYQCFEFEKQMPYDRHNEVYQEFYIFYLIIQECIYSFNDIYKYSFVRNIGR